jgi:hypothetical protein
MKSLQTLIAAFILVLTVGASSVLVQAQDDKSRLAHANGQGTIKVGQEQFKVTSVIVKLLDDKSAELTLVSDITFFLSGTWSQQADSDQNFEIKITGGASGGGLEGAGTLTLGKDTQSAVRLDLKGQSRTSKKIVEVHFEGK